MKLVKKMVVWLNSYQFERKNYLKIFRVIDEETLSRLKIKRDFVAGCFKKAIPGT